MPIFCSHCGTPAVPDSHFCSACGAPFVTVSPIGTPVGPASYSGDPAKPVGNMDAILAVEPGAIREGLFKSTPSALIITQTRLVFVPVSGRERKDVSRQASLAAKSAGRDVYARAAASYAAVRNLYAGFAYSDPLLTMQRYPGSFVIERRVLDQFLFAPSYSNLNVDGDWDDYPAALHIRIPSRQFYFSFESGADERWLKHVTEQFYAGR